MCVRWRQIGIGRWQLTRNIVDKKEVSVRCPTAAKAKLWYPKMLYGHSFSPPPPPLHHESVADEESSGSRIRLWSSTKSYTHQTVSHCIACIRVENTQHYYSMRLNLQGWWVLPARAFPSFFWRYVLLFSLGFCLVSYRHIYIESSILGRLTLYIRATTAHDSTKCLFAPTCPYLITSVYSIVLHIL